MVATSRARLAPSMERREVALPELSPTGAVFSIVGLVAMLFIYKLITSISNR
jgi:hypothetical protein